MSFFSSIRNRSYRHDSAKYVPKTLGGSTNLQYQKKNTYDLILRSNQDGKSLVLFCCAGIVEMCLKFLALI